MDGEYINIIGSGHNISIRDLNEGDVILYDQKLGVIIEIDGNKLITIEYGSSNNFAGPSEGDLIQYVGHSKVYTKYFVDATDYYKAIDSSEDFKNLYSHVIQDMEYLIKAHKLTKFLTLPA